MDSKTEPEEGGKRLEPSSGDGPSGSRRRRPSPVVLVALALCAVIALAVLWGSSGGPVETNLYRAKELLLQGELDPESFVFRKDERRFEARRRAPDSLPAGEPRRIAVQFVTDEEVDRFREEVLDVYNESRAARVDWNVEDGHLWQAILQPVLWISLILVLYFVFLRQLRAVGPGRSLFSFGRSRARVAGRGATGVTFDDVAGVEEAKQEVSEIVQFLRDPERFRRIGGRIPRGVLLVGSPGTGKTLLARAIAGEADVPFFSISGSDFVEMFVGVGAARVRDLFRTARDSSPCIVFIDEVDAVGRRRGTALGGGHDEKEQTLNAILVELDGFDSDQGVIVLGATNRPDVLDPALLRPGRFDRSVTIDLPDLEAREKILRVHAVKTRMSDSVDMSRVARATPGFNGAELAALVNEAAIIAALNEQEDILERDLLEARDKLRWGRSKKTRVFDEEDRRITAYHEAGHALVALLLPEVEPLHKVTIIPRGMSLGSTMQLPEKDRFHMSRRQLAGNLVLLYAGRVAEEKFLGDVTAGARSDIERATDLARRMVCEWGMSKALGPIDYSSANDGPPVNGESPRPKPYSEHMARRIDEEVRRILDEAHARACRILDEHRDDADRIARALLERETLTGEEVAEIIGRSGNRCFPEMPAPGGRP